MYSSSRKPLLIAFLVATVLSAAFAIVLYLNEDLRRTTFVLLEKTEDENGGEKVRVKIEKPKPNRDQIREIARNKEKQKKESLKRKAREVRDSVVKIEKATEALKEELNDRGPWRRMVNLANKMRMPSEQLRRGFRRREELATHEEWTLLKPQTGEQESRVLELVETAWEFVHADPDLEKMRDHLEEARDLHERAEVLQKNLTDVQMRIKEDHGKLLLRSHEKLNTVLVKHAAEYVEKMGILLRNRETRLAMKQDADAETTESGDEDTDTAASGTGLEEMNVDPEDGELDVDPENGEGGALADSVPGEEEFEKMSVEELYDSIRAMTEMLDQAYAENRAAALAASSGIPLEEALGKIYAPQTDLGPEFFELFTQPAGEGEAWAGGEMPEEQRGDTGEGRESLPREGEEGAEGERRDGPPGDPSNMEEYERFSEGLNRAEQIAEGMARTARNRGRQAAPGADPEGQTGQQLRDALNERTQMRAQMSRLADNQGRGRGNVQDLRATMMQSYLSAANFGENFGGLNGPVLSGSHATEFALSEDGGEDGTPRTAGLSTDLVLRQAIPGRKLDREAERKGWIFLDTWYIIGPWDRPRVNSFEHRFPPETEVNLDTTYPGKRHPRTREPMELEWRFVQTENIRINPPDEIRDAVYYGYTEVFAETATEVVVAVASDDTAKLWINGLVVWEERSLSPWRIDEGFRRILLKPGYNTVLIRVDNGPLVCYFSVLMCPLDAIQ
jgi:hypothetical protein